MNKYRHILSGFALAAIIALCPPSLSASESVDAVAIESEVVVEPTVTVNGEQVEIEIADDQSHQIVVYALTGQIVKSVSAEYGRTVIELPRGYYIVKVDRTAKRVIIK